jgi:multidrug efflux pump subunit AcrA (membrane-fusion protein)
MTRIRLLMGLLLAAVIVAAGLAMQTFAGAGAATIVGGRTPVPLTAVRRGSLELTVRLTGELRAARQATLMAPSVGGLTLRVLSLLDTGTPVRAGDVVVEFDPSDQIYALEQAESELLEAEQEIIKRRADIEAQLAQEQVTLLTAKFDVRRAELDALVDADLITANEYKIRQVTLEEARRRLEQVERDVDAHVITAQASLEVLGERVTRSRMSAERARQNMTNLELTAPMDGIVSVFENRDAVLSGGFIISGMAMPTFRVGDDARAGRPIVNVFDVSLMEIRGNVDEQERAIVAPGQAATVWPTTVPGVTYEAKADRFAGPLRQFEVLLELDNPDNQLRPGTSVEVQVHGATIDDVLLLPRQSVFDLEGQAVVYVPVAGEAGRFEPRPVSVLHRSEISVAVEGLDEGTRVALVDPASVRAEIVEPVEQSPAGVGR